MSTFGDFDDLDAFDTEPADPEQVARKLHQLRHRDALEAVYWAGLGPGVRSRLIKVAADLIAWGRRQGIFR